MKRNHWRNFKKQNSSSSKYLKAIEDDYSIKIEKNNLHFGLSDRIIFINTIKNTHSSEEISCLYNDIKAEFERLKIYQVFFTNFIALLAVYTVMSSIGPLVLSMIENAPEWSIKETFAHLTSFNWQEIFNWKQTLSILISEEFRILFVFNLGFWGSIFLIIRLMEKFNDLSRYLSYLESVKELLQKENN